MSETSPMPRWYFPAILGVLIIFGVLFQIAHARRAAIAPLLDEGNHATNIAMLGRAHAQARQGMWPQLDRAAGHFVLPVADLPQAYSIAPRFTFKTTTAPDALLLGTLNNYKVYTLQSYADIDEYLYPGYAVAAEREGMALLEALRNGASTGNDITVAQGDGTLGSSTLYRLRFGLETALAHDGVIPAVDPAVPRRFPALIGPRHDGHAWVVFLDQHVERLPYPGQFPLTEQFISALEHGMVR